MQRMFRSGSRKRERSYHPCYLSMFNRFRFSREAVFSSLVLAFLLAFLWQGFDGWFRALGIAGYIPPLTAAWLTNGMFVLAGSAFLWREP